MLNFIVLALLNWIIVAHLHVPETLHTPEIHAGALTRFSDIRDVFHGSAANVGDPDRARDRGGGMVVPLPHAQRLRAARGGAAAGRRRIRRRARGRTWMRAMMLSGMLAGLGGINFVLGYKHYYEEGFAGGAGFLGIAVALVGRNHPVGVVLAALFFATLSQGGLAVNAMVPKQLVEVLQGIVILAVAASRARGAARDACRHGGAPSHERARVPRADRAHRDPVPLRGGGGRDRRALRA